MANNKPATPAFQISRPQSKTRQDDGQTPSTSKRRRRFGNRGRTGCKTCRARHMKCDESRPICKRCTVGRLKCEYALPPPAPSTTSSSSAFVSIAPLCQAEPPDWDLVEGFRYFLCYMVPRHAAAQTASTDYTAQFQPEMHVSRFHSKESFLMITTCNHITVLCAHHGRPARPGAWAAIEPLWDLFYGYMGRAIANLNRSISEKKPIRYLLYRVIDILSVELSIIDSPWRAHIGGFLGIVDAYGGVDAVMKSSARPPILALQFGLIYGTIGNACSPAHDQITGFDTWTDTEILNVYTHTHFNGLPCPSRIFLAIRQITRLRVAAASSPPSGRADDAASARLMAKTAAEIAAAVHGFTPFAWTERHDLPDEPLRTRLGCIFQHAVVLYALLSLPAPLAVLFTTAATAQSAHSATTTSSSVSISNNRSVNERVQRRRAIAAARDHHRGALLALVDALLLPRSSENLARERISWPLAVLGTACHHHANDDEQARVLAHLEFVRTMPAADCGAVVMLDLLPRFWASRRGTGAWEDCFYKPSQVMA